MNDEEQVLIGIATASYIVHLYASNLAQWIFDICQIQHHCKYEKHRARICYVTYCVMCTFLSKSAVGPQIMHSNRFKMHLERETMLFEGLIQSTDTSNSARIHLRSHMGNQCKVKKLYWFRLFGITIGAQHWHEKIRNNPSKYTLWTCDIASQSSCLHLVKIPPETRSRSTGLGLPLLDTYDQGVLEWCLSGGIHIRGPHA